MVIEVNDNPNLDHGVEDEADRQVWNRLTEWFVKRLSA
jgi:glutathione synthase/RimK-type ligase-like ATP-grasp enzyme